MKEITDREGRHLSERLMAATGPWPETQDHLPSVGTSAHGASHGFGFCACGSKAD